MGVTQQAWPRGPGLSSIKSSPVLEANTPAGKIYNLVIFGAILLSVVVLLEPNPLGNSALQQTEVLWIDLIQDSCLAVFAADFVLHLAVVPSPRKTLFSFTGLIDLSAVLFFFLPQTAFGRLLASVVMTLGFGIIAIPTGILTVSGVQPGITEEFNCSKLLWCPADT